MKHLHTTRCTQQQAGFTVFELMVATLVFSVILLVMAVGVIRFSHDYFKGVTSSNTQQVARAIMQDIAQNIQFGPSVKTGLTNGSNSNVRGICIGNTLYSYSIGYQVVASSPDASKHQYPHGLIKRVATACDSSPALNVGTNFALASDTDHELLGENMRLTRLDVVGPGPNDTYTVSVEVVYGDDESLSPAPLPTQTAAQWSAEKCKASLSSQFCAKSQIQTTVQQRLAK